MAANKLSVSSLQNNQSPQQHVKHVPNNYANAWDIIHAEVHMSADDQNSIKDISDPFLVLKLYNLSDYAIYLAG